MLNIKLRRMFWVLVRPMFVLSLDLESSVQWADEVVLEHPADRSQSGARSFAPCNVSLGPEFKMLSNPLSSFGEEEQGKETISVRVNYWSIWCMCCYVSERRRH
jgi:hypothetical protein